MNDVFEAIKLVDEAVASGRLKEAYTIIVQAAAKDPSWFMTTRSPMGSIGIYRAVVEKIHTIISMLIKITGCPDYPFRVESVEELFAIINAYMQTEGRTEGEIECVNIIAGLVLDDYEVIKNPNIDKLMHADSFSGFELAMLELAEIMYICSQDPTGVTALQYMQANGEGNRSKELKYIKKISKSSPND